MNLEKIGKFIAKKRQEKGFTQESLAEELDISNRSVSKWERGICLPDSNNLAKLCKLFGMTYNELLSGEEFNKSEYEKRAEEKLKEFSEMETATNKKFFFYENVIGILSAAWLVLTTGVAAFAEMPDVWRVVLIVVGLVFAAFGFCFCTKIETEVGKYECAHCGHLYVPKFWAVNMAMHFGRTRYMTCPKCGKKSWQRKRI